MTETYVHYALSSMRLLKFLLRLPAIHVTDRQSYLQALAAALLQLLLLGCCNGCRAPASLGVDCISVQLYVTRTCFVSDYAAIALLH